MQFLRCGKIIYASMAVLMLVIPGVSWGDAGKHQNHGQEATTMLDDQAIFAMLDQFNAYDIELATIALAKGHSQSVKNLASMIVSDHPKLQRKARDLATKLGVAYTVPTSNHLAHEHQQRVAQLESKSGTDFDNTYLNHETSFSQEVVHTVEHKLIPAAHHEDLKQLLSELLPELKRHLSHMSHGGDHSHMH